MTYSNGRSWSDESWSSAPRSHAPFDNGFLLLPCLPLPQNRQKKNPSRTCFRNQNNVSGVKNPQRVHAWNQGYGPDCWEAHWPSSHAIIALALSPLQATQRKARKATASGALGQQPVLKRWTAEEPWAVTLCYTKNNIGIKKWLYNYNNSTC